MIRWAMMAIAALAAAGTARAQDSDMPPPPAPSGPCMPPELTAGTEIVMLGMYGGTSVTSPYRLDERRQQAQVVAVAGGEGMPVILILSAYEPTIWDLSQLPAGRIRAVYANGFYPQAVSGLAESVPIIFRTAQVVGPGDTGPPDPCPRLYWPYGPKVASWAAARVRAAFGDHAIRFYGSYAPFSFDIDGRPLPKWPSVPALETIRAEAPVLVVDPVKDSYAGTRARWASEARRPRETIRELAGRRLLQIRWRANGDLAGIETESFGLDHGLERISTGEESLPHEMQDELARRPDKQRP